jgi:hypothetical protein
VKTQVDHWDSDINPFQSMKKLIDPCFNLFLVLGEAFQALFEPSSLFPLLIEGHRQLISLSLELMVPQQELPHHLLQLPEGSPLFFWQHLFHFFF